MIKNITSVLLIVTMLCMVFAVTSFAAKPDESWITYTSENGNAELTDDFVSLDVATEPGQSGVARAKKSIDAKGNLIYFSVMFGIDANEEGGFFPDRTIYISDNSDNPSELKKASVLACVSGTDLLGGMDYTDMQTSVSNSEKHLLCAVVDMTESSIDMWFDGEYAGKTTLNLSGISSESDLCLIFENTYPVNKKKTLSSNFTIYDVCDSQSVVPEITVTNEDYTDYFVNLGTIATSAKIFVEGAGEYTSEFTGGGFNLKFDESLNENKLYNIIISDITTLDGEVHTVEYVMNKKDSSLELSYSGNYSPEDLSVFKADVTGEIQKVSYYADDKFIDSVEFPFEIDLSGLSYGNHTIKVSALSPYGDLMYDSCEISVSEKNKEVQYLYDFEDIEPGAAAVNASSRVEKAIQIFTNYNTDGKYIEFAEVDEHSKALVFGYDAESNATAFTGACFDAEKSKIGFESDLYFFDANSSTILYARGLNSAGETVFMGNIQFEPKGDKYEVQAYDGQKLKSLATVDIKKWYTVNYEFDLTTQKYSFSLDGEKLADNYGFNMEFIRLQNMVRFHSTYKANSPSKIAIDNVSMAVLSESMHFEPASALKGDKNVDLKQCGKYTELKKAPVVTSCGREIALEDWNLINGYLELEFKNPLMMTGKYDVIIEGKNADREIIGYFTVENDGADISDIAVFASEGVCTVEFKRNQISGGENLIYIVNRYSDSKLLETYTMSAADADGKIENIAYNDGDEIKAFVLKKTSGAQPFSDVMVQSVLSGK